MFYQQNSKIIDTPSTYLDPNQVFTGNYWDEFGLTPYLVPDNARVLMLGLAFGGGLRSLLSSSKNIHLTCVDSDTHSSNTCRAQFRRHFPEITFHIKNEDAKSFLQNSEVEYDFIWLDLYNLDSYSSLYFDEAFLKLLNMKLTAHGVLAVNAYGIPTQFAPLSQPSAQRECARHLQRQFPFVGTIPNRRNQTLLASKRQMPFYPARPHPKLSALDKRSFVIQGARLNQLQKLPLIEENISIDVNVESKFSQLDLRMRHGWHEILKKLNDYEIKLNSPGELLALIQDPKRCQFLLDQALLKHDFSFCDFIPILCAGESHVHSLDVEWIFSWILNNHKKIPESLRSRFVQVWLTQLWALVLHPSKKHRAYCFQVFALFEEAL